MAALDDWKTEMTRKVLIRLDEHVLGSGSSCACGREWMTREAAVNSHSQHVAEMIVTRVVAHQVRNMTRAAYLEAYRYVHKLLGDENTNLSIEEHIKERVL